MITEAKPIPLDVMVGCRDSCGAWLARSLGLEAFANPAAAAWGLVFGGGLSPKQMEVARALIWLDRALPMARIVEEHKRGDNLPLYIRPRGRARWYEVETAAPSDEDIQIHLELAAAESELNDLLRDVANLLDRAEPVIVRLCALGMSLDESMSARTQRGRVVRAVRRANDAGEPSEEELKEAETTVREWKLEQKLWDVMMLKYAGVSAEVGVLRELVQLRRPFEVKPAHPFSSLVMPSTLDEWRDARRVLEKSLFDAGFGDGEIAEVLPDGTGDGRRRVAARRKRMGASTTAV